MIELFNHWWIKIFSWFPCSSFRTLSFPLHLVIFSSVLNHFCKNFFDLKLGHSQIFYICLRCGDFFNEEFIILLLLLIWVHLLFLASNFFQWTELFHWYLFGFEFNNILSEIKKKPIQFLRYYFYYYYPLIFVPIPPIDLFIWDDDASDDELGDSNVLIV